MSQILPLLQWRHAVRVGAIALALAAGAAMAQPQVGRSTTIGAGRTTCRSTCRLQGTESR